LPAYVASNREAAISNAVPKRITGSGGWDGLNDPDLLCPASIIGGRLVVGGMHADVDVLDPATGETIGQVPALGAAQARAATDAAAAAFPGWAGLLPQDRSAVLRRWYELIRAASDDLALIMTREQGKPLSEARGEIAYAASFVEFYAEEAKRPNIEGVTSHLPDAELEVWREPVGVAALITPWNFPAAMLTRKAAAALAAGCTTVAHPSIETPFSATALALLAQRAGIPDGVFNVVTGHAPEIVGAWTADPRIRALSFTGSPVRRCRQAADPRVGWSRPVHRFCRCRPRPRGGRGGQGQVRDRRAGLPRRQPIPRRAAGL
jgi:aspartate-semialdehyde dehydrogenase